MKKTSTQIKFYSRIILLVSGGGKKKAQILPCFLFRTNAKQKLNSSEPFFGGGEEEGFEIHLG